MAETMRSIQDLMMTGMTYVLDFERKASAGAQTMADASSHPEVKEVFAQSVSKGKQYAQRIEEAFGKLGVPVETKENSIAKAMLQEVENMISSTEASAVRDAALIVAANQMQHYRIAVYGSLGHYAELIGQSQPAEGLKQNLDDSKGGDEKLTRIAEEKVNQEAARASLQSV